MRISVTGPHTDRGFTLIELLVVLCVIGLLSAAGAVLLVGREERQMGRHALAIAEILKSARRAAQVSGKGQQVDVGKTSLSIAGKDAVPKRPGGMTIRLLEGGQRIRGGEAILFFSDGSSTGGLLELSRKGETRRVSIDWWGQVHVAN